MEVTPKQRQRTIHVVSLAELASSPKEERPPLKEERPPPKEARPPPEEERPPLKEERPPPDDLLTLLANLRQTLLKKTAENDKIDADILQHIESIGTRIGELNNLPEQRTPAIVEELKTAFKTYISDLLSITQCPNILSDPQFQDICFSIIRSRALAVYSHSDMTSDDALIIFYRLWEFLSLPMIEDFLRGKYPKKLFSHLACIIYALLDQIEQAMSYITFKKNDLQNQVPILRLLVEYTDKNKQNVDENDTYCIVDQILSIFWNLADNTILVPNLVETTCAPYFVKWISLEDVPMWIRRPCIHILHNLARHDQGAKALNNANCISVLKDFKKRVLDPNKANEDGFYAELRLLYCMVISLLTEPKENREDLKDLRKALNQLMELLISAGESSNNKDGGFHVSEPLVVLTKLCLQDEILDYIVKECPVTTTNAKSKIEFFCHLLMKFRGALASENDLDQLTLTAMFNLLWSISFHDEYVEELKSDSKFLLTVKSLANDDGEAWVEQYIPKYLSSIPKAANGILWNLDENNPARAARIAAEPPTVAVATEETKKTKDRMLVMVSYSHADSIFCHQLVEGLQKDNRFEVWVDFAYCHSEDLWEEISQAIENADTVLFLMSKDYQDSKSCRTEVMYTKDTLKKRFIPIYMNKEFVATRWLGIRIVGPQYIRFGKKSFDQTLKELITIIVDDTSQKESGHGKEVKPAVVPPPPAVEDKPVDQPNLPVKPAENNHEVQSDLKLPSKPVEKWMRKDIKQWFDQNNIPQDLVDLYDFQRGTDLLLYGQCLRPDWQIEYTDMRARYQQKYSTPLYRDQFVRLVGAINYLQPSQLNSKTCVLS